MRIHDRLDDRETDSGSSVCAGSRLIDFIELCPEIRDRLLRDRSSGIEDRYTDESVLRDHPDDDLFLAVNVVDRIAQIVGNYLLDLKLVRPDIDRCLIVELHLDLVLLNEDL